MTYDEAVKFCEEHDCEECPVHLNGLDKRTEFDKVVGAVACCENLVESEE